VRDSWRATWALGAILPLAVAACAHEPAAPPPSAPSPLLGAAVPAFRRPTVQGPIFDSSAAPAHGRVLVVDFFAAYCQPCQRALPALEALHAARPDVEFVGVSLDEGPEGAVSTILRHRLTFPVVHDEGHVLAGRFRVAAIPASFVVDASGRVVWAAGTGQSDDALARAVAAVAGSR
jgi:thiol-disulfide isomerase/thioredoxin